MVNYGAGMAREVAKRCNQLDLVTGRKHSFDGVSAVTQDINTALYH